MGPQHPSSPPGTSPRSLITELDISPISDKNFIEHQIPGEPRNADDSCASETPSSVEVGSTISRELSDLSGSLSHGSPSTFRKEPNIPRNIYPTDSQTATSSLDRPRFWKQAYVLSTEPKEKSKPCAPPSPFGSPASVILERFGVMGMLSKEIATSNRFPLVILLMDPWRKHYELMQIWVDLTVDTVRHVLQSLRHNLPKTWKIDYDGLVQHRGGRSSLLINCFGIRQFDAIPHEIWIAKPSKMPKDVMATYLDTLLDYLKDLGVIHSSAQETTPRKSTGLEMDGGALTLSKAAQDRVYAPEGIMSHHHACHFLTFVPSFEALTPNTSTDEDTGESSSIASDLSQSSLGVVKKHDPVCNEESQEVVLRLDILFEGEEEETVNNNSRAPLLHNDLWEAEPRPRSSLHVSRSPKQPRANMPPPVPKVPPTSSKENLSRRRLFSLFNCGKRHSTGGFQRLDIDETDNTFELTDEDLPVELADGSSVFTASAPLLLHSSGESRLSADAEDEMHV